MSKKGLQRRMQADYQTQLAAKEFQIVLLEKQAVQSFHDGLNFHTPFEAARANVIGVCMSINMVSLTTPDARQRAVLSQGNAALIMAWDEFSTAVDRLKFAGVEVDTAWLTEMADYVKELRRLMKCWIVTGSPADYQALADYCDTTTTQLNAMRRQVNVVPMRQRDMEAAEQWLAGQLYPAYQRSASKAERGALTGEADSIRASLTAIAPAQRSELQTGVFRLLNAYQPEDRIRYRDNLARLCKRWHKQQEAAQMDG